MKRAEINCIKWNRLFLFKEKLKLFGVIKSRNKKDKKYSFFEINSELTRNFFFLERRDLKCEKK